jgi:hypothetical protein
MSERPTDTRRAAAAHGLGRDARALHDSNRAPVEMGRQTVADRAANFRQGAPFLVERATLYDPEPLEPSPRAAQNPASPPRRLLPAALTLLGVVVVVGLAASVLFVRNADVVRHDGGQDGGMGRLEQFSDRGLPRSEAKAGPGPQPNSSTISYDLTRRPNEVIVGAWRSRAEEEAGVSQSPPAPTKRRPLPQRLSAAPPHVPPEPVTRPVVASPPRYDVVEPRRRVADGDPPSHGGEPRDGRPADTPPPVAEVPPERHAPSVVARVGRESEHLEQLGPPVEIPPEALALPHRRPNPGELENEEEMRDSTTRARRSRILYLQRRLRREQRHARRREYNQRQWIPEALYGNRFLGVERLLP